ncbi:hypothetical protein E2C01_046585 [Portunus trituberculatus]|uniref:Uncharacterized protein n=1 Tax=Portunus trituberculatus TaxID=210409 RepID=A0A5B7G573_PORTR|nr:hypothetical protein [Portunus trituberculatus]
MRDSEVRIQGQTVSHSCLQLNICFLSSFLDVCHSHSHQIYACKVVIIS